MHNKKIFYIMSFTWGIVMSLIGCLTAAVLIAIGKKPQKFGYCLHFEIGSGWGGVNLGPIIITSTNPSRHTKCHEHGHAQQNCLYGPCMLIVGFLSSCRYWYRELRYYRQGLTPPTAYDDAWYEEEASKVGTEFMDWYENNTK
jgi:hypothetical protein